MGTQSMHQNQSINTSDLCCSSCQESQRTCSCRGKNNIDESTRVVMGENGRRYVVENHRWDVVTRTSASIPYILNKPRINTDDFNSCLFVSICSFLGETH